MSAYPDRAFEDWKADALKTDILAEALKRGAKLKRSGAEWYGPCPVCGGKDRFAVNIQKRIFICRGEAGGDVIGLVQHLDRCDFLAACQTLAGRPPPHGQGRAMTAAEEVAADARRLEREKASAREAEKEQRRRKRRVATAAEIWAECRPVAGTIAEAYLIGRGIPVPPEGWPDVIGFHGNVEWEIGATSDETGRVPGPRHPALVARIQDMDGETVAIQQIFLSPTGKKAPLDPNKVTLGPFLGGAVRLGGLSASVDACEGIETGLAVREIIGYRRPVWCCMGTSGLAGVEPPLGTRIHMIWPDGDYPRRSGDGDLADDSTPPGIRAARQLLERLMAAGIPAAIAPEPAPGNDYLDVLNGMRGIE